MKRVCISSIYKIFLENVEKIELLILEKKSRNRFPDMKKISDNILLIDTSEKIFEDELCNFVN